MSKLEKINEQFCILVLLNFASFLFLCSNLSSCGLLRFSNKEKRMIENCFFVINFIIIYQKCDNKVELK